MLNASDGYAVSPTTANYVLGVDQAGKVAWTPNRPEPSNLTWFAYECGSRAADGRYTTVVSTGTVAPVQIDGLHQGAAQVSGGSASGNRAARVHASGSTAIVFDTGSGTFVYDCEFQIPTVDAVGSLSWTARFGFQDTVTGASVDGAWIEFDDGQHANFQCVTSSNSTRTTTDSGIAATSGQWVRVRVKVTNNSKAEFWISTTAATSSAPFVTGSPTVTISTNIPTGTTRATGYGLTNVLSASTGTAFFYYTFQLTRCTPVNSPAANSNFLASGDLTSGDGLGLPNGFAGQVLDVSEDGNPQWDERYPRVQSIPWWQQDVFSGTEFSTISSGTGAAASNAGSTSGQPVLTQLACGTTSSGACTRFGVASGAAGSTTTDATSATIVLECIFSIPNLSTGTQQFLFDFGIGGDTSKTPSNGIVMQIDAQTSVDIQFTTSSGGVTTTTTTTFVPIAGTFYYARIVITNNTTASLYVAAIGSSWSTALATNTTNIPTGGATSMTPLYGVHKNVGTTSRTAIVGPVSAYQRRVA